MPLIMEIVIELCTVWIICSMRFLSMVKEIYSVSFWVSPAGNETDFLRASKECYIYLRIEIRS